MPCSPARKPVRVLLAAAIVAGALTLVRCSGGGDDTPTGPQTSVCSEVGLTSSGAIYVTTCTGTISSSITNITYDQFGRRLSYNFDITCGSRRYTGSVSKLTYNSLGVLQSGTITVNGVVCPK